MSEDLSEEALGRQGVMLRYQEAYKELSDLAGAVSNLFQILEHYGIEVMDKWDNSIRFQFTEDSHPRTSLKDAMLTAFSYLNWHCQRCGKRLEGTEQPTIKYVVGRFHMCEACAREMGGPV